eukprot:7383651-Prymnesium_polylepis.2
MTHMHHGAAAAAAAVAATAAAAVAATAAATASNAHLRSELAARLRQRLEVFRVCCQLERACEC